MAESGASEPCVETLPVPVGLSLSPESAGNGVYTVFPHGVLTRTLHGAGTKKKRSKT